METAVTTKVLDNTVITASIKEIRSINLIKKCSQFYQMATSSTVYLETNEGFGDEITKEYYSMIRVHDSNNEKYILVMDYLKERYPYIHEGEISAFAVSFLEYETKGKKCYYVTDDKKMKKVISRISRDSLFYEVTRMKIEKVNITGTIGLIKRVYDKGGISKEEINKIITDLQNSTFYITPELINVLRGYHNETEGQAGKSR